LHALPFQELRDPETGRTRVRTVDIQSEHYISTRQYMIRLEPQNLTNPEMRAKLAEAANMSPADFGRAFASAVGLTEQEAMR
jgi:6-phosphofructokinase 1